MACPNNLITAGRFWPAICQSPSSPYPLHYFINRRIHNLSFRYSIPSCQRISQELEWRILQPYLDTHFWWMESDEEPMCNWTPWCTQNVLLTAFLHGCTEDTGRQILLKAAQSCDLFLKDYGEDGCCDEGAQYFRRAGLCLDAACDLMDQVTGSWRRLIPFQKKATPTGAA